MNDQVQRVKAQAGAFVREKAEKLTYIVRLQF